MESLARWRGKLLRRSVVIIGGDVGGFSDGREGLVALLGRSWSADVRTACSGRYLFSLASSQSVISEQQI